MTHLLDLFPSLIFRIQQDLKLNSQLISPQSSAEANGSNINLHELVAVMAWFSVNRKVGFQYLCPVCCAWSVLHGIVSPQSARGGQDPPLALPQT